MVTQGMLNCLLGDGWELAMGTVSMLVAMSLSSLWWNSLVVHLVVLL